MTPFPHSIEIDEPLLAARRMMLEHHVHHLPVVKNHQLQGIISDRDIKLLLGPEFDYPNPRDLTVADAYVENAYAVDINTMLKEVLRAMAERRIGAAVVTRNDQLAGIFTAVDACRTLAELLSEEDGDDLPDQIA